MSVSMVEATEERFWKDLEPLIFDVDRLKNAPEECRRAISILEIGTCARILDIGCGVGRHSNYLASLGHHVEGIDKVPHLILQAGNASTPAAKPIFHIGDIATYAGYSVDCFDHAICFYHSLGFNPDPADDLEILTRVSALLRPKGRLFFELIDPDGFEPGQRLTFETTLGNRSYTEEIQISQNRRMYELTVTEKDAPEIVYRARHRLFSRSDMMDLLQSSGFDVTWPGPEALTVYTGGSKKFCALAEKTKG